MAKSKISVTAAKVISDIIYETLKNCTNVEQRRAIVELNNQIIKKRYEDEDISYESCEAMINCFDRERVALGFKIKEEA